MNFLPFQKLTIETKLTPVEIGKKLGAIIGSDEYIANPAKVTIPYYGVFDLNHFKMHRVRTLIKNDFAPVIEGHIVPQENFTLIEVRMRFKYSTLAFFMIALVFFSIMFFSAPSHMIVPASGMFLVFYIIAMLVFNYGTSKAIEHLNRALHS